MHSHWTLIFQVSSTYPTCYLYVQRVSLLIIYVLLEKRLIVKNRERKTAKADTYWPVALGCWGMKTKMPAISHSAHLP